MSTPDGGNPYRRPATPVSELVLDDYGQQSGALATISGIEAEGWYTALVDLPPAEAKYDVRYIHDSSDHTSVWAFNLAQYEP